MPDSSDNPRANIVIDPEAARRGEMAKYYMYLQMGPYGDGVPWFKSCRLTMRDVKQICADLMRRFPND